MTEFTANFTFEGDEIFAIHEGKVIASGTDMDSVESDATAYLDGLKTKRDQVEKANAKKTATHIITPNGVKGQILSRTPDVWGDEQVTARFDNGQIGTFTVHGSSNVKWLTENIKTASVNPAAELESRLAADFERDIDSLKGRHDELLHIGQRCASLITAGAPYAVEVKLDELRTAAEYERTQVKEAIDHLDANELEGFVPDAPFAPRAVEQADLGGRSDSWLDNTTQQMIQETEEEDLDKLLDEGPAVFVTDLDNGALADAGVTQEMAFSHVVARTAGYVGDDVDAYREQFVARAEVARRHELASRKTANHKEAAAAQETQDNAPDEALFL